MFLLTFLLPLHSARKCLRIKEVEVRGFEPLARLPFDRSSGAKPSVWQNC